MTVTNSLLRRVGRHVFLLTLSIAITADAETVECEIEPPNDDDGRGDLEGLWATLTEPSS